MSVRAFVFDMDGTILDSLPDLANITNMALARMGLPQHSRHEVLTYVGNGAERLVERAVPQGTPAEEVQRVLALWRDLYLEYGDELTEPFPRVVDLLRELRRRGIKTAVLSNKFDAAVRELGESHFPGLFDIMRGEIPPTPRKPDPTALLQIIEQLGVEVSEVAYVGDTNVDIQTARNAGVMAIGVSWGYDEAAPMPKDELDAYISDPAELLSLV